mgnify:CR=1 FL=1
MLQAGADAAERARLCLRGAAHEYALLACDGGATSNPAWGDDAAELAPPAEGSDGEDEMLAMAVAMSLGKAAGGDAPPATDLSRAAAAPVSARVPAAQAQLVHRVAGVGGRGRGPWDILYHCNHNHQICLVTGANQHNQGIGNPQLTRSPLKMLP